jgi:iron complex outermembrane receptor protein
MNQVDILSTEVKSNFCVRFRKGLKETNMTRSSRSTSPDCTASPSLVAGARLVQAAFGLAAVCVLAGAPAARAQTSSTAAGASDSSQTITVTGTTARKRNEQAQDVPITMDVIGGQDLRDAGITRVKDLQSAIPGLVIETRESSGKIAIRGVGTGDVGLGTDQSVAVHVDGVYQAHGAMGLSRMFDVERVEVLRGPQGTLYGRNATAGVVNLVSRAPRMKFGAEADVSFGNFGLKQVQGMINVPLGEQTALRLALIASDSTGSATNVFDGSKIGASEDFHGVRGRLRTQLGGFGVDLAIQYINDRSTGFIVPHPELASDRLGATTKASYDLSYYPDGAPNQRKESLSSSLTLTKDLGDVRLTSITGYGDFKGGQGFALARPGQPPAGPISVVVNEPADQWSQELQLSGAKDKIDWVAGLYYISFDGVDQRKLQRYRIGFTPFDTNQQAGGHASAVYGDVNWRLSPSLRLNLGLRYTRDTKDGVSSSTSDLPFFVVDPPQTASQSWSATTGRIGLDWKLSPRTMLFGSVSTGYKAGGVVPNYETAKPFDIYRPEKITALEVGQKTTLANDGGLFNLSAYHYDYKDKVEIYGPTPATFGFFNAPKARVAGVDGYLSLKLARHLRWDLNAAWLDATFKDFPATDDLGDPVNYAGNRIARAPKLSATTGITFDRLPVGSVGLGQLRLEYTYRDEIYFDFKNAPVARTPAIHYVNLSARLDSRSGNWYAYLAARNLTDKRWIEGLAAVPGGAGILYYTPVNQGRSWQLGAGFKF